MNLIQWARGQEYKPLWALVPDVVADREKTIERWDKYEQQCRAELPGIPLAFAVQDGMQVDDVPQSADVVFIGGSTEWKWATASMWCAAFPRVHIGRVNGYLPLMAAAHCGAESCDGTGWFRGDKKQLQGLEQFLAEQSRNNGRSPRAASSVVAAFTKRGINVDAQNGNRSSPVQTELFADCGSAALHDSPNACGMERSK